MNITALPYRPYWIEKTKVAPNGTAVTTYTGSDGLMMHAMAQALNFTFHVLPSKDWNEVGFQDETMLTVMLSLVEILVMTKVVVVQLINA